MTATTDARERTRPHWETGARLSRVRTDLFASQREMANALDMSPQVLSHWERGRRLPSTEALAKLARLGVDIGWVLTGLTTGGAA